MELNLNDIIMEVQKRPVLWDSRTAEYKNRSEQKTAWRSIAVSLVPDFVKLGIKEQRKTIERIRQIWHHQRACYMRNPNWKTTMGKREQGRLERLTFLKPIRDRGRETNLTAGLDEAGVPSTSNVEISVNSKIIPKIANQAMTRNAAVTLESLETHRYSVSTIYRDRSPVLEARISSPIQNRSQIKEDSDRNFLKSLLPSVKRLSDGEKLIFRMKVLQLMLEIAK
ncbi:hypothetical protein Trydic_g388 [Trypoxylus dichotomus]